jgi:hypothetical protein
MKDNALYLEVDEDITSAIDKLNKAAGSSVQIVVPKRSTLLQSVINQKLLKKAADDAGKKLVLVTNDRVATDLAARVGVAVATSVGAEAVLTAAKKAAPQMADDVIEDGDPAPATPPPMATDELDQPAPATPPKKAPVVATRALSDDEPAVPEKSGGKSGKPPKGTKVPNFTKLRKRALWIAAVVVGIAGYLVGMYFLSSGSVTLYADGAQSNINTTFNVDTSLTQTDTSTTTVAGQALTTSHNLSTSFTSTGTQDVGSKASGTMTITNSDNNDHSLVAGTRFVAPDGNVFLLNNNTTIAAAPPVKCGSGYCPQPTSVSAGVTATANGDNYNEAGGQKYSIPGLSTSDQAVVTAQGGQMSGGVTKTVQIVAQSDVDTATTAAVNKDKSSGLSDLQAKVPKGDVALPASLTATPTNVTSNPAVGAQGTQATLTLTVNYSLLVVNKSDYTKVIENIEQQQLGANNKVYDNGIGTATITAGAVTGTRHSFHFVTVAAGGPNFDTASIINNLRGKKYSDASDYATGLPGVVKATVSLSPVWSTSMPHIAKHIHVFVKITQG